MYIYIYIYHTHTARRPESAPSKLPGILTFRSGSFEGRCLYIILLIYRCSSIVCLLIVMRISYLSFVLSLFYIGSFKGR